MKHATPTFCLATVLCSSLCPTLLRAQLPDFRPTAVETVLSTDAAVVPTVGGGSVTVVGGIFRFRTATIPAGAIVRGIGSNPMIWIVDDMIVDGTLSASGSDGERVNTLGGANFVVRGGAGGPAAGRGGDGSPQIAMRSFAGRSGNGPGDSAAIGGTGGIVAFAPNNIGSGGGGGAFATAGDPFFPLTSPGGTSFVQVLGLGGFGNAGLSGSATRTLPGGGPGGSPFADGDDENDFLGIGVDAFQRRVVIGELPVPIGGSGGGGGGDLASAPPFRTTDFVNDSRGGGGGGGGGCIIVVAIHRIVIGQTGAITANGGNGGGGEQAGSCNQGGGGGGGSGGMIVLVAGNEIELNVHGETFANGDVDFSLSADGGIGTTSPFLGPSILTKYSRSGAPAFSSAQFDARPFGGWGGLGVVQMMTRPGRNADGTNTVFDDNIRVVSQGTVLTGAQKQRFLGWRGYKNAGGVRVDDFGAPITVGGYAGDIIPAPVLLPLR